MTSNKKSVQPPQAPPASDRGLRKQIRKEIRQLHTAKKPVDRAAIKAKFGARNPTLVAYINTVVEDYAAHLEGGESNKSKAKAKASTSTKANGQPPSTSKKANGQPSSTSTKANGQPPHKNHSAIPPHQNGNTIPQVTLAPPPPPPPPNPSIRAMPQGYYVEPVMEPPSGLGRLSRVEMESASASASASEDDSDNAILQDFKEHLAIHSGDATNLEQTENVAGTTPTVPSLEEQMQFLNWSDDNDELTSNPLTLNLNHSVLLSPALEDVGLKMPSQYSLLGKLASTQVNGNTDSRVMLNTNIPFSAFICGLQGSGKSHTTSCIIENCSMPLPALGSLKKSVSTLVLHFNEYSSNTSSQPSEAAFVASVMPEYASHLDPIPLRVLVSPTNFRNLEKMYSQIPNVQVRPFKLQPRHLNISMMLSLMSMSQTDSMPLYMAQVTRVLRIMAMESGGYFDYADFRTRLSSLRLDRAQTPFLYQRLDLLDSYLDLTGETTGDYFVDGGVTILDLSCPFVDQSTACILFRIAIDLFLYSHPSRGKMIVADEAHKYMTHTTAAKELTETFLNIIRQQRHLGVRTVISTQEPTVSPKLIDLCSVTIVHRFTSPEWYSAIQNHVPIQHQKRSTNEDGMADGLYRIASLRTGEALVFAPSAHLLDGNGQTLDTKHRMFKMSVRKRITWDGGRTITTIR